MMTIVDEDIIMIRISRSKTLSSFCAIRRKKHHRRPSEEMPVRISVTQKIILSRLPRGPTTKDGCIKFKITNTTTTSAVDINRVSNILGGAVGAVGFDSIMDMEIYSILYRSHS